MEKQGKQAKMMETRGTTMASTTSRGFLKQKTQTKGLRASLGFNQALQLLHIRGCLGDELSAHGAEGESQPQRHAENTLSATHVA